MVGTREFVCRARLLKPFELKAERDRNLWLEPCVILVMTACYGTVASMWLSGPPDLGTPCICGLLVATMLIWLVRCFLRASIGMRGRLSLRGATLFFVPSNRHAKVQTFALTDLECFGRQGRLLHLALGVHEDRYLLCPRLHAEDLFDLVSGELENDAEACDVYESPRAWRAG